MKSYKKVGLADWINYSKPEIYFQSSQKKIYVPEYNLSNADGNLSLTVMNSPAAFVSLFENCALFSDGCVILTSTDEIIGEGLTHRDYDIDFFFDKKVISVENGSYHLVDETTSIQLDEECVYLGGSSNIGHFIFEYLSRVFLIKQFQFLEKLPLVVYDDTPDRFLEILSLFGVNISRLIKIPRGKRVLFRKMWVPSCLFKRDLHKNLFCSSDAISFMRSNVRPYGGLQEQHGSKRLFFSRSRASSKRVVNEFEIVSLLKKYDFQVIDPADYSIEDQLKLVCNAEIIWGPLGAATSFTLFAPDDCIIVEMTTPSIFGAYNSIVSARLIGQTYCRILGKEVKLDDNPNWNKSIYSDLYINLNDCVDTLEKALVFLENKKYF